jgi:hypothetical protein
VPAGGNRQTTLGTADRLQNPELSGMALSCALAPICHSEPICHMPKAINEDLLRMTAGNALWKGKQALP